MLYIIALGHISYKVYTYAYAVNNPIFTNPRSYAWSSTATYDINIFISNFNQSISEHPIELFTFRTFLKNIYKDKR